jgi:hypothetical protein
MATVTLSGLESRPYHLSFWCFEEGVSLPVEGSLLG